MFVRFPLVPYNLEHNAVYDHLQQSWGKGVCDWSEDTLMSRHGKADFDEVIRRHLLTRVRNDRVKLTFQIPGTAPHLILKLLRDDVVPFGELLIKLPRAKRVWSVHSLKHWIAFLENFNQVQYFALPCSATAYVALEDDDGIADSVIDELFETCITMEAPVRFEAPMDDGLRDVTTYLKELGLSN